MRAASVLTGKPITSAELANKTNLSLGDCREFLGKLGTSQCLQVAQPGSDATAAGFAPTAQTLSSASRR